MNKKNQMLANKMVRVAKSLMALSADDEAKVMVDYKAFVDGKKKFEDAHKDLLKQANDLQKQIDELEEQKKALEATLKGEFKIFDKEVGITKTAKAAAGTLADMLAAGEDMGNILSKLEEIEGTVRAEKSQKPSYASAYKILCAMLNGSEFEKYVKLIEQGFAKNIVSFETTLGMSAIEVKRFDKGYEKEYNDKKQAWEERNPGKSSPFPVLKAKYMGEVSRTMKSASTGKKVVVAGIGDVFKAIKDWVMDLFSGVANAFKKVVGVFTKMSDDCKKISSFSKQLGKACDKVR